MRLLLVDDSKAIHTFIKGLLQGSGFDFSDAFDGNEAVEKIRETGEFTAILLDWEMPYLSGIEALKKIREVDTATPILMVTTKNNPEHIAQAFEHGADEYIMKPFTKEILTEKLNSILDEKVA